jgi:hypothetical protein
MGGQCVLRHFKQSSEIAGGQSIGLVLHQYPEGMETGLLGEGAKRQDGLFVFHISRFMEILGNCQLLSKKLGEQYFEYSRITV